VDGQQLIAQGPEPAQLKIIHKHNHLPVLPDLIGHLIINDFKELHREIPVFTGMTGKVV
jgi:hypothetical protein